MSDYNPENMYNVLYLGSDPTFFMNSSVKTYRLIGPDNVEKGLENRLVIRQNDPEEYFPALPKEFAEYYGLSQKKNIQEDDPLIFNDSLKDIDAVVLDMGSPMRNEYIKEKLEFDLGYKGKIHVRDYEHGITIEKIKKQVEEDSIQP